MWSRSSSHSLLFSTGNEGVKKKRQKGVTLDEYLFATWGIQIGSCNICRKKDFAVLSTLAVSASAVTLHNLQIHLVNAKPGAGARAMFADGVFNLVFDGSCCVIWGHTDCSFRKSQSRVTTSIRPHGAMKCEVESSWGGDEHACRTSHR